jgi:acyl-coenzyme A thioesterase PaaI-like protein
VTHLPVVGRRSGGGFEVDPALAGRIGEALAVVNGPSTEAEVEAARRAGESVRRVIERLTATSAPPELLAEVTARMDEALRMLEPHSVLRSYRGSSEASGLAQDRAFFDWSPLLGLSNPVAPPIRVSIEDGKVVGRGRFGIAYEGPPGCVHGGLIAAAFDEILGLTQSLSGAVGMTGTLTIRYRRPTPLHRDLRFEGTVEGVAGRKVTTSARLWADDELTAEATGLFVTISPEKFQALQQQRLGPGGRAPGGD